MLCWVLLSCFATMTILHVLKFEIRYLALSIKRLIKATKRARSFLGFIRDLTVWKLNKRKETGLGSWSITKKRIGTCYVVPFIRSCWSTILLACVFENQYARGIHNCIFESRSFVSFTKCHILLCPHRTHFLSWFFRVSKDRKPAVSRFKIPTNDRIASKSNNRHTRGLSQSLKNGFK